MHHLHSIDHLVHPTRKIRRAHKGIHRAEQCRAEHNFVFELLFVQYIDSMHF